MRSVPAPHTIIFGDRLRSLATIANGFAVSCGMDPPYRPHMQGDGLELRRGKGLKTICIARNGTGDSFNESDIPYTKTPSQCMDEFDNYVVKQEHFNNYVKDQLRCNSMMIDHLSDLMFRIANAMIGLGKHASMVHTELDQVAKSQND